MLARIHLSNLLEVVCQQEKYGILSQEMWVLWTTESGHLTPLGLSPLI